MVVLRAIFFYYIYVASCGIVVYNTLTFLVDAANWHRNVLCMRVCVCFRPSMLTNDIFVCPYRIKLEIQNMRSCKKWKTKSLLDFIYWISIFIDKFHLFTRTVNFCLHSEKLLKRLMFVLYFMISNWVLLHQYHLLLCFWQMFSFQLNQDNRPLMFRWQTEIIEQKKHFISKLFTLLTLWWLTKILTMPVASTRVPTIFRRILSSAAITTSSSWDL